MTLSAVIKRMHEESVAAGGEGYLDPKRGTVATPHGFRSSFKDWARSSTSYADEVSELALAHVNSDETRAAYARDELVAQRMKLMTDWAKFCQSARRKRSAGKR
jgi:integrase